MELLERAECGDLDEVKRLIQKRARVNTTNCSGQTALYFACENGHTEVAQYLLANGASVELGEKPLIAAVRYSHYACVKLLLQYQADANGTNSKLESPMSVALQKNHYPIILSLIQHGAIPSDSLDDIAFQLLKLAKVEHTGAVQKLIDRNFINLTPERTFRAAFDFAFKHGSVELAQRMLSNDSYPEIEQLYPAAAYYSAKNNWPAILTILLEKRVDINVLTDGQTPLYIACKEGHESVMILLLNNGADPNVTNIFVASNDLSSPLQIAVQRGNTVMFEILLEKGAKLNPPGEPLLHIACSGDPQWMTESEAAGESRYVEHILSIIRPLLQQGVDVNATSDKGDTALYRACISQQLEIVQVLIEAGADVDLTSRKFYPLIAACKAGNVELIGLLVKAEADVKCRNSNRETCLHAIITAYTSITGSQKPADSVSILNIIKSFLEGGVDINACCSQGETALYRASKDGHEHFVRLLLEAGAETGGTTSRRSLYAACEHGHTEIVGLLLHYGADPNAPSCPSTSSVNDISQFSLVLLGMMQLASSNSFAICCAAKNGYSDIVNLLLEHGADVNKQDGSGKSALITFLELMISRWPQNSQASISAEAKDLNVFRSMLLAGGDANMISKSNGHSTLHIASSFGICDIMMELIQHGANCNQLTSSGKSSLDLACEKAHEGAVELLLKNGAELNNRSVHSSYKVHGSSLSAMPVLCTAAKSGSETIVKLLLQHGASVNDSDKNGNTALHLATSNAVIRTLLNAGANVNAKNDNGETALSVVCEKQQGDAHMVETFLKFKADPNVAFPLHAACQNDDTDTVRLLLAYGADANLVKESTSSELDTLVIRGMWMCARQTPVKVIKPAPLCIACKNGNAAIVDCLLANGAAVTFADSEQNTPLHFAIEGLGEQVNSEGYDPIVTLLLEHDAPVNVVSSRGETPLYAACTKGLAGVVKQLLDCKADVGLTTSVSEKYPLMIACEKNFGDVAMMLLDRGADADVNKDKYTPLKLASANGDVVLVKRILSSGANVNQMQGIGDTALHVAVVPRRDGSSEAFVSVVRKLLKSGAEPNVDNDKGETPLYLACNPTAAEANVSMPIVQILLENGADPNMYGCPPSVISSRWFLDYTSILSPLSLAAAYSDSELTMLLIKFGARVNQSGYDGRTALHFAVGDDSQRMESVKCKSCRSTVEKLLSAGADVNAIDKNGASPLYLACDTGNTELVKMLLSHGANPNIKTRDMYPILTTCKLCKGQYCDTVKQLLKYKADVNVRDVTGKTALHYALESSYHHSTDIDKTTVLVQLLIDGGADINSASENGETPFYISCSRGLTSVVNKMLQYGAKVDGINGKKLPLNVACKNKHMSVVQLLLTCGANPNAEEEGVKDCYHCSLPLHIASANDNSELVELLLKHDANIDVADTDGNTALHRAIEHYSPRATASRYSQKVVSSNSAKSVVDILLENKADVNLLNNSGETPMYRAASSGLLDVVSKMLQVYGGNPNKGTRDKSPLVAACHTQSVELVDTLLKHGADPDLTGMSCDSDSKSTTFPLFVAVDKGNSDIVLALLNAGANANATTVEGKSIVCLAAETLTTRNYYQSSKSMTNELTVIRSLLEHGATFNMLMPDGRSPLYLAVSALKEAQRCGYRYCKTRVVEFCN